MNIRYTVSPTRTNPGGVPAWPHNVVEINGESSHVIKRAQSKKIAVRYLMAMVEKQGLRETDEPLVYEAQADE